MYCLDQVRRTLYIKKALIYLILSFVDAQLILCIATHQINILFWAFLGKKEYYSGDHGETSFTWLCSFESQGSFCRSSLQFMSCNHLKTSQLGIASFCPLFLLVAYVTASLIFPQLNTCKGLKLICRQLTEYYRLLLPTHVQLSILAQKCLTSTSNTLSRFVRETVAESSMPEGGVAKVE